MATAIPISTCRTTRERNRLYRNEGDGTFVDVARRLGVALPIESFPTWFWDYDNDGTLDLFVASFGGRVEHLGAHYKGMRTEDDPSRLYRGNGRGGFDDVTRRVGLAVPMVVMGSNFGDLDGDGRLDMYLGSGAPSFRQLTPNWVFMNRTPDRFRDRTMASGMAHLQKGHSVAFADLDNDGDLDVFEQMGGAYTGDAYYDALYANPGFGNLSLHVRLIGTASNRSAIGARITAIFMLAGDDSSVFRTYRHVGAGGSFGSNPLRQTIGWPPHARLHALEVFWPRTGTTQTFRNLPTRTLIEITEGRGSFHVRTLPRFDLADAGK